jgi:hypothetical protein
MAIRRIDIIGSSLPILADIGEGGENADYRPVPESDRGNEGYEDRGYLGSYAPDNREPFRDPPDVRYFAGYGATEEDLRRGYCEADVGREPAYDKANYEMRSTQPRASSEAFGNTDSMPRDFEFRSRNQRARGFLTRPRIPTER